MALSLESPNLVRQKVYAALGGQGGPAGVASSTELSTSKQRLWWATAREFFDQWVAQGNANLQFLPYDEAQADDADGTDLADSACKVYMFYVKKLNAATANTVKLYDNVTGDSITTEQTLSIPLDAANQEAMIIYPTGFSHATGVAVTQHTTIEGSSDGSDGGNGFVVIGAA